MLIDVTPELTIRVNYEDMYKNIQRELKKYLIDNKLKSLVLGVSGGIDSALCAALAIPVCEELKIPLIGVSLSMTGNKSEEIERAKKIGTHLCTEFKEITLSSTFESVQSTFDEFIDDSFEEEFAQKIRYGNIKARLRMIYLYNLAQFHKGMVLSTDNYTEYLLGFWTLHGDVGDYGMIQTLWKTEVYGLSKWISAHKLKDVDKISALMECVLAVPTDGLGITNSDLEQLGADSYEEVDRCLLSMFGLENKTGEPYGIISKRNINSEFKRNNPFNIQRYTIITNNDRSFT